MDVKCYLFWRAYLKQWKDFKKCWSSEVFYLSVLDLAVVCTNNLPEKEQLLMYFSWVPWFSASVKILLSGLEWGSLFQRDLWVVVLFLIFVMQGRKWLWVGLVPSPCCPVHYCLLSPGKELVLYRYNWKLTVVFFSMNWCMSSFQTQERTMV